MPSNEAVEHAQDVHFSAEPWAVLHCPAPAQIMAWDAGKTSSSQGTVDPEWSAVSSESDLCFSSFGVLVLVRV